MHSATLRGTDFEIIVDGSATTHADFFATLSKRRRVGIVAPQRVDGVGAAVLVMAHVTAFYDRYREEGGDFFAYPDYFTFQYQTPLAHYSMLDIWPLHKNVYAGPTHVERLNAINDRAISTLIVPDGEARKLAYERPQLESARRNITSCYLYAFDGNVAAANMQIRCAMEPIMPWVATVFTRNGSSEDTKVIQWRTRWEKLLSGKSELVQSYRRVSLDDALARL